ncbi:hypothetical protein O3P69_000224 [Scylla paramamosain]|uniref:Uncharacterized protein n=1 Tax=Scylla paramamosain TaxID=85552 RepID=A0AAW0UV37_SCYPA
MRVLLLLGCGFVLVAAGGEDSGTTTLESNTTVEETHAPDQPTTPPVTHQDTTASVAMTSVTPGEESIVNSTLSTMADTTLSSSGQSEEPVMLTVPSPDLEAESSARHEVPSTASPTTITTSTIVPTAVVTTLLPPQSTPDTETTSVQQTSFSSISHPPGNSTPSAAQQPTAAVTVPPATSTNRSTEQETTSSEITRAVTTTTTTTIPTTTKPPVTPARGTTVVTADTTDANTTSTTTTTAAINATTMATTNATSTDNATSEDVILSGAHVPNVTSSSSGVCFGKTEVNTLVVVAVVVAVNVVSVALTALCVHRLVSRRLSWDPPPIYRHRSTRSEKGEKRTRGAVGKNLASDKECKAGEGQASTQIPILITNEDGWCVPYSNEGQDGKKKREKEMSSPTEDTGV